MLYAVGCDIVDSGVFVPGNFATSDQLCCNFRSYLLVIFELEMA